MTQLFAQPYDISARGFYFETVEEFRHKSANAKNDYGDPVEEFEIQFIDGVDIDCCLASAWGINQANIGPYFTAVDDWDLLDKQKFIIAVGEVGYQFDPDSVSPDDFDVEIYDHETMKDLAEEFVDEGMFGDIPDRLRYYIDTDAIASDLAHDYTQTEIAGDRLIYRVD